MEAKWYAVYTKPRWEKKVADLLTKKGLTNYCPLNKVRKQWADRKKTVYEPLFTSYVFVYVTELEHLILKKTSGVINLVYWLGKPARIRDEEILAIKIFLEGHINVKLEKDRVNLNDEVRIVRGPLADYEGRVLEKSSRSVKVWLPSLGFVMTAEVGIAQVEVIRSAESQLAVSNFKYAL